MKSLEVIVEADQSKKDEKFEENMLLSFYNWPQVESSSVVLQSQSRAKRQDLLITKENARLSQPILNCRKSAEKNIQM
jgi:hypothetical protein